MNIEEHTRDDSDIYIPTDWNFRPKANKHRSGSECDKGNTRCSQNPGDEFVSMQIEMNMPELCRRADAGLPLFPPGQLEKMRKDTP